MKNILTSVCFFCLFNVSPFAQQIVSSKQKDSLNLFIITVDGFRWQEVFEGADSAIINDENYTPDAATVKSMYWTDEGVNERRRKLLPFFWNVIAPHGQLLGNRNFDNKLNVANPYAFSYPGYSELLTGKTDLFIYSNKKKMNRNINLLEYLEGKDGFHGKVAAFTSWNVFPYILGKERNSLPLNSGYEIINSDSLSENEKKINSVQLMNDTQEPTRNDRLTFIAAKEFAKKNHPRVLFIGLGETDEFAHHGRYDIYLEKAAEADHMIAELWHWAQTTPGYKDNTVLLITTDHGRGGSPSTWKIHGPLTKGSSQTWMACIGPGIEASGEMKVGEQYYTKQLASTFGGFLGIEFGNSEQMINTVAGKE
ncbi:MAG: alkaline phosphatase family protein [Chitinophagaceae bacterium]